jgi:hypothetical protein
MQKSEILSEASRLHALGFALIWLHPASKRPIERGWTLGPRSDLKTLKMKFNMGNNMGVRLGAPSMVGGKYLTVIDLDVKSKDARHRKEAEARLLELIPEVKDAPIVASGRGNGSAHYYVLLSGVVREGWLLAQSAETVRVMMPSVKPSQLEEERLSFEDKEIGYRLRPAWEISILSEGRHAVLPPSVHPDTGKNYEWLKPIATSASIPSVVLPVTTPVRAPGEKKKMSPHHAGSFKK